VAADRSVVICTQGIPHDRPASTTIRIGGVIEFVPLPALLEAIECDSGLTGWEGKQTDMSSISDGAIVDMRL
jgi:hypothetical protein